MPLRESSAIGFFRRSRGSGAKSRRSHKAPEKKMLSQAATKLDLRQLKTDFIREFTARMCLILAGAVALLFGLLKVF
jgi:hypothetical protein